MDFPSGTTINCNKATFWYYNKQMAVLGGKSTYLSVLGIFVFYPPITVLSVPVLHF